MIKAVEFPDRTFKTREELFKALRESHKDIIDCKCSEVRFSDTIKSVNLSTDEFTAKAIEVDGFEKGFVYPVINTTNYMDSHNDVHLKGIWNKSIGEQQGKILYVTDHELSVDAIIAHKRDVEMMIQEFSFKELGYDSNMKTQALVFKVALDKIKHAKAKEIIEERHDIEHSVRMQYVDIQLAMNSDAEDDAEFKAAYDENIDKIANKEKAQENEYFWLVKEAKIFKEGSMVATGGSNNITPMTFAKDNEPSADTQDKQEPLKDTPNKNNLINFYKHLK